MVINLKTRNISVPLQMLLQRAKGEIVSCHLPFNIKNDWII